MKKRLTLLAACCCLNFIALFAQGVAINTDASNPDASSMIDVKSTSKGILVPRMTQAQRDAIPSPATSLMIYQSDLAPGFYFNAGTPSFPSWQPVGSQAKTAAQIALLQWHQPITSIATAPGPRSIAFDGTYMWVSHLSGPGGVTKYDASGAVVLSNNNVPSPWAIAFDGSHIWAASTANPGGVVKMDLAGSNQGSFMTSQLPSGICFDGTSMWTYNPAHGSVTKVNITTGAFTHYVVPGYPNGLAFDGTNLWVGHSGGLSKIDPATGNVTVTFPLANGAGTLAFDGMHIWASSGSNTVIKVDLSGNNAGTYTITNPGPKAFDGSNMWILSGNTVVRLNLAGTTVATYPVGNLPSALAFDGTYIWVVNSSSASITKIHK